MIANLQEQYGIVIAPSTLKLKLSQLGIRTHLPRRIQPPQEEQEEEPEETRTEYERPSRDINIPLSTTANVITYGVQVRGTS